MSEEIDRPEETTEVSVQLLYKCFLGQWLDIDCVKPTQNGYDIHFVDNDITKGLRVQIDEEMKVFFF